MTLDLRTALRELLDELDVPVVAAPIGPKCTIRLRDGSIIRGHRVPDDYAGPDLVHWGESVDAVWKPTGEQLHLGGDVVIDRMELQVNGTPPPSLDAPRRRACRRR